MGRAPAARRRTQPPRRLRAPRRSTPSRCRRAAPTSCPRMTETRLPDVLLAETEVALRVEALAQSLAPHIDDETVAVCLLTGGLGFCADLPRALSRAGGNVAV